MAPQPQLAGKGRGKVLNIPRRLQLGGHHVHKAEVKILLPAHQGAVGAPEGQKGGAVVQQDGEGGKLGLLLGDEAVGAAAQPQPGKPAGTDQCPEEGKVRLTPEAAPPGGRKGQVLLRRLPQGDGLLPLGRAVEVDVGQHRQDQPVHGPEGDPVQRQVPPPGQVVQEVTHRHHSFSQSMTGRGKRLISPEKSA